MMSAITYIDELGWYSNLERRRPVEPPRLETLPTLCGVKEVRRHERRVREPAVCVNSCSITTSCLPFSRNSGTSSDTRRRTSSFPSWISSHAAAEVIALVDEKTQ